jgi:hypothetical protein
MNTKEYEVVWSGALERRGKAKVNLVPDRETRVADTWTKPHRIYNKTGKYSKKRKEPQDAENTNG